MFELRVLGEIELREGERHIRVRGARQQGILAALLIEANRPVTNDQLLERVWGTHRWPARPGAALRSQITLLRRALAPAGGVTITWQSTGYRLVVDVDQVDLHLFHRLVREARNARNDDVRAERLHRACALRYGDPFASLDTPWLVAQRAAFEREHHAAQLDLMDTRLRQGQHAVVIAGLTDLSNAYPWDERVAGQLMLALYRSGRRVDALNHYQQLRHRFVEQLGTDPGPPLQNLHQQIITADSSLVGTTSAPAPRAAAVVPRQLPAPPRIFVGRDRELASLSAAVNEQAEEDRQAGSATMPIMMIDGMGGVGKTALAMRWAHRHAERFPDGQLYVDLCGFTPNASSVRPEDALRGFLAALGVDLDSIPTDLAALAAQYRSLVADKRMLILLDNARDSAQVMPLLPGSPTCTVVITSRQRLTDLVAGGAHRLDLDVLTDAAARDLLAQVVGSARVAVETAAVADLVLMCAGLPLAIGIVAARANTHPGFPLGALAAELRDARKLSSSVLPSASLPMADADEVAINLDVVFASSYRNLDPDTAALFGLVGLAPGPDISTPAAASLAALSTTHVRTLLRTLEDAHLLQQHRPGRYRTHDLIRRYAANTARQQLAQDQREAGLRRVVDFYLHTAYHADRLLHPHRLPIQLDPPAPGVHAHALSDIPAALDWFDREHPALLTALHTASRHSWHSTAWQLAWSLETFHVSQGHRHDRLVALQVALDAAAHLPDPAVLALAHRLLGDAYTDLGRYEEAMAHLHHALTVAEENEDADQQARTHRVIAWVWAQQGDHRQALEHATRTLELWRTFHYTAKIAEILNDMGWYAAQLGQYDLARAHCTTALELARRQHDTRSEAGDLVSLGYIEHHTGHHRQAVHHYQRAHALYRALGDAYRIADCLEGLGHPHAALGEHHQARTAWREALGLYRNQHRATRADGVQQHLASLDEAR